MQKTNKIHWNLYIGKDQYDWLKDRACLWGTSMASLVREAIDIYQHVVEKKEGETSK